MRSFIAQPSAPAASQKPRCWLLVVVSLLTLAACSTASSPPRFALSVPAAFSANTERQTYRRGAPLASNPTAREMFPEYRAESPTTKLFGRWTDPSFVDYQRTGTYHGAAKHRGWTVEVRRGASPKVTRALQAKDGYEADLGETLDASPRIYPRFHHKHFSWGKAVSFLVQYQNDNTNNVPNNGELLYEVHGVTSDGRYTVRAQFGVTHPRLQEYGPEVRDHREEAAPPGSPMRRDPDYLLVERCADGDFQPGIADIDAMLETLRPGGS